MSNISRYQVQSSQIAGIGYDEQTKTLAIEFKPFKASNKANHDLSKPSSVYHYHDFPKDKWDEFRGAKSIGSHFHKFIRGKYTHIKQ